MTRFNVATTAAGKHLDALPAVDMTASVGGAVLPQPVLTASGCAAAGRELDQFFDINEIGALVTKSVMLAPRAGRPTPRMAAKSCSVSNSGRFCPRSRSERDEKVE